MLSISHLITGNFMFPIKISGSQKGMTIFLQPNYQDSKALGLVVKNI